MTKDMIDSLFIKHIEAAEQNLCLELQGHMHEKMADFNVMKVATLADFIAQHAADVNQKTAGPSRQDPREYFVSRWRAGAPRVGVDKSKT